MTKSDRKLCMVAVAKDWQALQRAVEEMKGDLKLCLAAVAQDWQALQRDVEEMKGGRELFKAAFAQSWQALETRRTAICAWIRLPRTSQRR